MTEIQSIQFGVLSEEEILRGSVCEVDVPRLISENGGEPNSVYDPRLGVVNMQGGKCATCDLDCWECNGHTGHIRLNEPVLHPLYYKLAIKFLRCFCVNCLSIRVDATQVELHKLRRYIGAKRLDHIVKLLEERDICLECNHVQPAFKYTILDSVLSIIYKTKTEKTSEEFSIREVYIIFDGCTDEEVKLLGFDPRYLHPRNLVIRVFPVLPLPTRPFVSYGGALQDDDLSYQLAQIVTFNNQLASRDLSPADRMKKVETLKFKIATFFNNSKGRAKYASNQNPIKGMKERLIGKKGLIRQHCSSKRTENSGRSVISPDATLKLNEIVLPTEMADGLTVPVTVTDYNIKWLQSIVDGKVSGSGRQPRILNVRSNMMHEHDAADVVENKLHAIDIFDLGPFLESMKKGEVNYVKIRGVETKLRVTFKNMADIIEMAESALLDYFVTDRSFGNFYVDSFMHRRPMPRHGDILRRGEREIIVLDPQRTTLQTGDKLIRNKKITEVQVPPKRRFILHVGDICERSLMDGDIVMLNRQPTLYSSGFHGVRVIVMPGRTLRFNFGIMPGLGSDCDGDECNIFVPQSQDARAELETLSIPENNIMLSRFNANIIAIVQDGRLGAYKMTLGWRQIPLHSFNDMLLRLTYSFPETMAKLKDLRAAFDQCGIHQSHIHTGRALLSLILPRNFQYAYKNDAFDAEPVLRIENGVILSGAVCGKVLGTSTNSIIHAMLHQYGPEAAATFIDNIHRLTNAWILIHGFSISLKDCVVSTEKQVEIRDAINKCIIEANMVESTTSAAHKGVREMKVTAALSQARDIGMRLAKTAIAPDNKLLDCVKSKSKGDYFNICQVNGLLSQQNIRGKRVQKALNNGARTLVSFPFEVNETEKYTSQGFIASSYAKGLSVSEFFFHTMAGRDSTVNTSLNTGKSGYSQRKMGKLCEDMNVHYDGTVRDVTGNIFMMAYDDTGLDPRSLVTLDTGKQVGCDVKSLVHRLNNSM